MDLFLFVVIGVFLLTLAYAGVSFAPWVPTRISDIDRIFELAQLQDGESFCELGCGTGRVMFTAADRYNVSTSGYEIAAPLWGYAKIRQLLNKKKNAKVFYKSLYKADLSNADVVYFFGMPKKIQKKLVKKLEKELKPGTRVISYVFPIDSWEPTSVDQPDNSLPIYVYHR